MKRCFNIITFVSIIVLSACPNYFAQVYGELFTNSEAGQKFGPVLVSVKVPTETVQDLLNQTYNYIMLKIVNNSVIVLDNNRNSIYPREKSINAEDVFTLFSVSIVNDLLSNGNHPYVYVEQRSEVLTISYGEYTLELGSICPPFC